MREWRSSDAQVVHKKVSEAVTHAARKAGFVGQSFLQAEHEWASSAEQSTNLMVAAVVS